MTDDIQLSIENLAADGSNWVSYRDRMVWTIESHGLAEHLAEASMTQTYINAGTVGHLLPQARWNMDNGIVKRLIGASVPNTIFLQIKSKTNVKEVWDALKALYETRSELAVVQLTNRFQSTKCGEDDNVRTHYELLADLREQLAAMGKTITDREYAGTLMGSLPPSYESVLSTISSSCFINQQALTSAMVLKLVLESFDCRQAANASKAEDEAFTTEAQKAKAKNAKPQMECFNCKKCGHIKANCWAKGGGKEGQGPKRRESRDAGDKRGNATGVMLLRALRPDVGDLGSLWVGRVTWTGSAWGPGSLLGGSTMYEYYYGMTQDGRLSLQGQCDRSEKNCTKAEASQR